MKKRKIGIIGCGTIGSAMAHLIRRKYSRRAELVCLCDHNLEKARRLSRALGGRIRIVSMESLISHCDFIIEAASAKASAVIAGQCLRKGKDILVMSVGGLLTAPSLLKQFERKGIRLWIPSGAVAGIDGLLASMEDRVKSVTIKTTKPLRGLLGAPYFEKHRIPDLRNSEAVRVFRGNALQAVKAFPQNINVAAVLSLAGIGPRRTKVEIWTGKKITRNTHEVRIQGKDGEIIAESRNVPSALNPKTSALAVSSAKAVLRKAFSTVHLGT